MIHERLEWPALSAAVREECALNWRMMTVTILGLTILNATCDWLDPSGRASFYVGIVTTVAQFLLTKHALGRHGYNVRSGGLLPFVGLTILWTLGIGLGSILFILPGLWLNARWFMAGPIFIAERQGVVEALRESFVRTKDSTWPLVTLTVFLILVAFGPLVLLAIIDGGTSPTVPETVITYFCMFAALSVSWLAAVAVYRSALTTRGLQEVFA